jgi:hypothetical protein
MTREQAIALFSKHLAEAYPYLEGWVNLLQELGLLKLEPTIIDSTYPPIASDELVNCQAFDNINRAVITHEGIYIRTQDKYWVKLEKLK